MKERDTQCQVEVNATISRAVEGLVVKHASDLVSIKDRLMLLIREIPCDDDESKAIEIERRWKRSAAEILQDGYVYKGKSCSDVVIVFVAMCSALGLETRVVKLISVKQNEDNDWLSHTISEVKVGDDWYWYDVRIDDAQPQLGEFTSESRYINPFSQGEYRLWRKGRDLWDIGLTDSDSWNKLTKGTD